MQDDGLGIAHGVTPDALRRAFNTALSDGRRVGAVLVVCNPFFSSTNYFSSHTTQQILLVTYLLHTIGVTISLQSPQVELSTSCCTLAFVESHAFLCRCARPILA